MQLPTINTKFLNNKIIQHLLFWSFFYTLGLLEILRHTDIKSVWMIISIPGITMLDAALIVYLNLKVFIPRFFNKNKYYLHIFLILITAFTLSSLSYYFLNPIYENIEFSNRPPPFRGMHFWASYIQCILLVTISSLIHFTKEGIKLKDVAIKLSEVEKEKLDAELKSLKAQVNPHFLFNMLNNIYSLSLEKSDKSPKMILMLSDLMSHILYDCQEEKVSLAKEKDFLKNLIDLEQISIGDDVDISFSMDDSLNTYMVSPLLFMPFVENAFKHCSKNGKILSFVNIKLSHNEDQVCLQIENSIDGNNETIKDNYHGVGIANVQKRLALLYPETHQLNISEESSVYKAELCLKL